jgi:Tol biopolymer transport system component
MQNGVRKQRQQAAAAARDIINNSGLQGTKMNREFTGPAQCLLVTCLLISSARAADERTLALYSINVETGEVVRVTAEPADGLSTLGASEWSPDGKRFLFDATPGTVWNRSRMFSSDFPLKKGKDRFTDLGPGNCPTWSPDGKQIAFLLNGGAVPEAQPGIWIMKADGSERRRLGAFGRPLWSPDGKQLLLVSFSFTPRLSVVEVETGLEQPVEISGKVFASVPAWVGNAETIVSVIHEEEVASIALVDLANPRAAKVEKVLWTPKNLPVQPSRPVYSAKKKRCAFVGSDSRGSALYVQDKVGAARLVEKDHFDRQLTGLAISPDGKTILFASDRKHVAADE